MIASGWSSFVRAVAASRRTRGFDLIAGGVADDQVYRAVDLYYKGLWTLDRTIIGELSFTIATISTVSNLSPSWIQTP